MLLTYRAFLDQLDIEIIDLFWELQCCGPTLKLIQIHVSMLQVRLV